MSIDISRHLSCIEEFSPSDFEGNIEIIKSLLKESGIVFVKNINSNYDAEYIASKLGTIMNNIDSDLHGVTEISNKKNGNNKRNSAAFTSQELNLHTDRSPLSTPPNLLINWMCVNNCMGGETLLVDGYDVFNYIKLNHENILHFLQDQNVACFTDGINTFSGPIFSMENNMLKVRFRYDQCSFFNLEAQESIRIFRETLGKLAHIKKFNIGCGYIIVNSRWLHGRKSFDGHRIVRRIHIIGKF
jgi:hypothetical protein